MYIYNELVFLCLPHSALPSTSPASLLCSSMAALLLVCLLSLLSPALSRSLEGRIAAGGIFAERKDYYSPPDSHGHGHGGSPPHGSHGRGAGSPPCTNPPSTGGGLPPTTPSPGGDSGGGHGYNGPPSSPVVINPPVTVQPAPVIPMAPPLPTTPVLPDPNSPFSCDYWRTHPTTILALIGYWCPLSQIFGLPNPTVVGGSNASLLDALANPRRDGLSELYREGAAAYLNSLATRGFYFTSQQVRDAIGTAAASGDDRAAASQAEVFRRANAGRLRRH